MNIYEALRTEIERNKELLKIATGTTPAESFRQKSITIDIELAEKALKNDDVVKIMRMFRYLKKNK